MNKEIYKCLKDNGVKTYTAGYRYVIDAIEIIINNNGEKQKLCKDIYEVIAQKYKTTSQRVERAIRYTKEISGYVLISNSEFLYNFATDILYNK